MKVSISPRKSDDRGGYACMPLKKNVPEGHTDWKLVKCPECHRDCWEHPLVELARTQGAEAFCTECALRKGMQF